MCVAGENGVLDGENGAGNRLGNGPWSRLGNCAVIRRGYIQGFCEDLPMRSHTCFKAKKWFWAYG